MRVRILILVIIFSYPFAREAICLPRTMSQHTIIAEDRHCTDAIIPWEGRSTLLALFRSLSTTCVRSSPSLSINWRRGGAGRRQRH